ncbi:hypothetical protein Trydic_g14669 [Trypoxylus dichotomus]
MRAGSPGTSVNRNDLDVTMNTEMDTIQDCNMKEGIDSEEDLETDSERLRKINQGLVAENKKEAEKDMKETIRELEKGIDEKNNIIQGILDEIRRSRDMINDIKKKLKMSEGETGPKNKKRKKEQKDKGSSTAAGSDGESKSKKEKGEEKPKERENEGKQRGKEGTSKSQAGAATKGNREVVERQLNYTQGWGDESTEVESNQEPEVPEESKERKPPPIVLREEGKLNLIRREAEANDIAITGCKNTKEGVKIFTKTTSDFRDLRRLLEGKNVQIHTFSLQEEKTLKVVLRGIPREIEVNEVEEELRERGFPVVSAARMKRFKEELPLVMVNVEKGEEGKKIFDVRDVAGMRIRVEPKRKPTNTSQCFRCQLYGHVQYRCTAQYKCMRCAGDHPSFECPHKGPKGKTQCANCGEGHHAASKNCPSHPENIKARKEQEKRERNERSQRREGVSFAAVAKQGKTSNEQDELKRFLQLAEEITRLMPGIKKIIHA